MAANETRLTTTPNPVPPPAPPGTLQAMIAQRKLENRARRIRTLDVLLLTLLLILAFALASTPIRNSDFLLHLATGRAIVQGNYQFGVDPFSHTTEGVVWVNHAWFFDLVLYLCYQTIGPAGIIVVKALCTVGLAMLLVRISRTGTSLWWPVVTTALALVSISPRLLLLQPTLCSFVLLPATLGILLWRGDLLTPTTDKTARTPWHYWPLWPLFVLWVNVDEWFILGPVLVGLFVLGRWLQSVFGGQAAPARPGELRALLVGLGVGIAVCVVNPHHIGAFSVPGSLGWFGTAGHGDLERDSLFKSLYYTPLQEEYYKPNYGLSVGGLIVIPLAALGLFSFLLNYKTLNYWRVLVWLAFLFLGMSHARAIPFFALVAGPIAALNFQEHAAVRWSNPFALPIPLRRWLISGRLVTVLLLGVLLVLCWPGRMHSQPYYAKRLAFTEELDPTLTESAKALKKLRADGVFGPDARGFNYSPEMANYLAWHCPEEKGFYDYRYHLQAKAAKDYVDIRRGMQEIPEMQTGEDGLPRARTKIDWGRLLKARKITHVILYAPDPLTLAAQILKFSTQPEEWTLLYADGHTAIYGANSASPLVQKSAFRPEVEALNPPKERWLDPEGPRSYPEQQTPWEEFKSRPGRRDPNTDEANMFILLFNGESVTLPGRRAEQWEMSLAAGIVAGSVQGSVPLLPLKMLDAVADFRLRSAIDNSKPPDKRQGVQYKPIELLVLNNQQTYNMVSDRGSEWYPLLAVRAARRGVTQNFQDAQAHMALGDAYLKLAGGTREEIYSRDPAGGQNARLLAQVRKVQVFTALNHAIALDPDLELARVELANRYANEGYLDLALTQAKEAVRLAKKRGPRPGEIANGKDGTYDNRIKAMEERLTNLQTAVTKAQDQYELQSATLKDDQQRAQRALALNLAEKALKIMREAEDFKKFGPAEVEMMIQLLLDTGQLKEVVEGYDANFEKVLGKRGYARYRILIAAARGNYKGADSALEDYGKLLHDSMQKLPLETANLSALDKASLTVFDPLAMALKAGNQTLPARPYVAAVVGQHVVESNPQYGSPLWIFLTSSRFYQRQVSIDTLTTLLRDYAEVFVLRGLLALEVGDTEQAAKHFRAALKEWNSGWDGEYAGKDPNRDYSDDTSAWDVGGHRMHLLAADYLRHMKKYQK